MYNIYTVHGSYLLINDNLNKKFNLCWDARFRNNEWTVYMDICAIKYSHIESAKYSELHKKYVKNIIKQSLMSP